MTNSAKADGMCYLDWAEKPIIADTVYGTITGGSVELQASHGYDGTPTPMDAFDLRIQLIDSSPGNGEQDLIKNGTYDFPTTNNRIKIEYNRNKGGQMFFGNAESGKITVCLDPNNKQYHGIFDLVFRENDQTTVSIKSIFGITIS